MCQSLARVNELKLLFGEVFLKEKSLGFRLSDCLDNL